MSDAGKKSFHGSSGALMPPAPKYRYTWRSALGGTSRFTVMSCKLHMVHFPVCRPNKLFPSARYLHPCRGMVLRRRGRLSALCGTRHITIFYKNCQPPCRLFDDNIKNIGKINEPEIALGLVKSRPSLGD